MSAFVTESMNGCRFGRSRRLAVAAYILVVHIAIIGLKERRSSTLNASHLTTRSLLIIAVVSIALLWKAVVRSHRQNGQGLASRAR